MYKNDLRLPSQKDINDNFNPSLFVKKTRLILYLATITIFLQYFLSYTIREIGYTPFSLKLSTDTMSVIE